MILNIQRNEPKQEIKLLSKITIDATEQNSGMKYLYFVVTRKNGCDMVSALVANDRNGSIDLKIYQSDLPYKFEDEILKPEDVKIALDSLTSIEEHKIYCQKDGKVLLDGVERFALYSKINEKGGVEKAALSLLFLDEKDKLLNATEKE